jgi:hypothetical protein
MEISRQQGRADPSPIRGGSKSLTLDEFQKLSALAAALIPHDEAMLTWPCPEVHGHLFLSAQGSDPRIQEPVPPGEAGDCSTNAPTLQPSGA